MKQNNSYLQYILAGALCAAIILGVALPLLAFAWSPGDPIVPACNLTKYKDETSKSITGLRDICTFCDFLLMIQNILNYMWWVITPAVLVIALIWGGALMFISSIQGDVAQGQKGKKIIFKTLIGLALVFSSWLIIDTVIKILGGQIASTSTKSSGGFGPWNQIECVAPVVSTEPPPALPPPIPPEVIEKGATAAICSKIRSNSRISYGSADCKGLLGEGPVGAARTIQDCADSKPPIVCSPGCDGKAVCTTEPSVTISPKMLAALDILGQERAYTLSSITTGSHSSGSCHYGGSCVDLYVTPKTKDTMEVLRKRVLTLGASSAICETKEINPATGRNYFSTCDEVPNSFTITHIHASFPK